MPWVIKSLTIGWPPQLKLERTPGDEAALHPLFLFLADKTLLRRGYGTRSGIANVADLYSRVDEIRDKLLTTLSALRPDAPIAEWLSKLQDACHELFDLTRASLGPAESAAKPSDIAPAVDELREAFALCAERVADTYQLPAAWKLAEEIREDIDSSPATSR